MAEQADSGTDSTAVVLAALAARCEAATPDQAASLLIEAFDATNTRTLPSLPGFTSHNPRWFAFHRLVHAGGRLDAAMMLLPDGLRLMLSEWDDEKHLRSQGAWQAVLTKAGSGSLFDEMIGYRCDHAATSELALTAAALRAHAASLTPKLQA